ncbi:hypothetical protein SLE2022_203070 [Rubroshorea leprosula]
MSAAAQTQTQQPVFIDPNTVIGQAPPSHHDSNGSFGTVFIVLAVIIVISAIACCLGRLCNGRLSKPKPPKQNNNHGHGQKSQNHHGHGQKSQNHRGVRPKEGDIEFGFDNKRMPPIAKPAGNGDLRGHRMPERGEFRGETKPADAGGELRGGA